MRLGSAIQVGLLTAVLAGCSSGQWYYAAGGLADERSQFTIDHGYCVQVMYGTAPPPVLVPGTERAPRYRIAGEIRNSSGREVGSFSATAEPQETVGGAFAQGFADGYALGEAIEATSARAAIYDGCMTALGWRTGKR